MIHVTPLPSKISPQLLLLVSNYFLGLARPGLHRGLKRLCLSTSIMLACSPPLLADVLCRFVCDIVMVFRPTSADQISSTESALCGRDIRLGCEPLSASLWRSPGLWRLLPDLDHDQVWVEDTPSSELFRFNIYLILC